MNLSLPTGTYAAVVTPRTPQGNLDTAGLTRVTKFVVSHGIRSLALNGATGEFCLTTPDELATIIQCVQDAADGQLTLLCGVGAAGLQQANQLAAVARAGNVDGLLLPSPIFFRYGQEDLHAFVRAVADATDLPILLYNLPQFSSGYEKETVSALIRDVPNVIGIKDSSGSLEILRHLSAQKLPCLRFVGNDSVIAQALSEGICDGMVSGVACAMPEAILGLRLAHDANNQETLQAQRSFLDEIIRRIDMFPAPWGIKWLLEARGVVDANFAQPLSPERKQQARELQSWFAELQKAGALASAR